MPYVVTEPESIRGVYESWAACQATLAGVSGVRYQKVKNREEAEAMLAGTGVVLPPGLYAFTDGNDLGGVGVLIVRMAEGESAEADVVQEIAASVGQIFNDPRSPGSIRITRSARRLRASPTSWRRWRGCTWRSANSPRGSR